MRLVFMGTPDFAVPALKALHAAGHDIVAVYSQPPRPARRGKARRASPLQHAAQERGRPVRPPHA
ncbi:MAG: methionyl-tRNA formyltransferase, partial [Acetobacter sp.]